MRSEIFDITRTDLTREIIWIIFDHLPCHVRIFNCERNMEHNLFLPEETKFVQSKDIPGHWTIHTPDKRYDVWGGERVTDLTRI